MKNIKGFTVIEGLLILVIVGLLGGTGWYVWHAKSNTDKSNNAATQASNSEADSNTTKATTDPTADWTTYSSKSGEFTVKYPKAWVTGSNQANCEDYLMLGTTAGYAGHCQSDATGEVHVVSLSGDRRADNELTAANYSNFKSEAVTVSQVTGKKQSGTFKGPVAESGFGPEVGANQVVYVFYTNNRTYIAAYDQEPTFPDMLSDFNTMVTKTLKFSS